MAELYNFEQQVIIPSARISDKKMMEGNSGTSVMKFKVTLNHASDKNVKMKYKTVDGTAKSGSDYAAIHGTLTFQPSQTTKYISVIVNGDITNESNEKFRVVLSNPIRVLLEDKTGMGTIRNDDTTFTQAQVQSAEKLSTGLRIILFPNPANNYISFSGVNEKNVFVEILDINKKAVLKQALTNNNIDVSKLAAGNYFVKLIFKEHIETLKLIKQ